MMNLVEKVGGAKPIKILTKAIVSSSEMIKSYKICREKAETLGRIFILKNNQPDAVLFSIAEYEKLSRFIEHLETPDNSIIADNSIIDKVIESLQKEGDKEIAPLSL